MPAAQNRCSQTGPVLAYHYDAEIKSEPIGALHRIDP
jgi:hypothetical protein